MDMPTLIQPERGTALNSRQECDLLRAAVQRNPASPVLRARSAKLLNRTDAFAETIALLTSSMAGPLSFAETVLLIEAYLALENDADTARAGAVVERGMAAAESDRQRAMMLVFQARLMTRAGRDGAAADVLHQALASDPHHQGAYRRLTVHLMKREAFADVLDLADSIAARGVAHSWLHLSRVLALIRLGRIAEAQASVRFRDLRCQQILAAPPGWDSLESFNAALAEEILANSAIRYDRYGTASRDTWVLDALATGTAPLARTLVDHIARAIERHVASLDAIDHPWLAARPALGTLNCWGVITRELGFEHWHVHPEGWMSGVYYVDVPDAVRRNSDEGGCIAFGMAEALAGEQGAKAFGVDLVRPEPGLLMLFPSYIYHRTFPHGQSDRRICVAFDIWSDRQTGSA